MDYQIVDCLSSPDDPNVPNSYEASDNDDGVDDGASATKAQDCGEFLLMLPSSNSDNSDQEQEPPYWSFPLLTFSPSQEEMEKAGVSLVERMEVLVENWGRCAWYYDDLEENFLELEID